MGTVWVHTCTDLSKYNCKPVRVQFTALYVGYVTIKRESVKSFTEGVQEGLSAIQIWEAQVRPQLFTCTLHSANKLVSTVTAHVVL